jgi:hypothetical protein
MIEVSVSSPSLDRLRQRLSRAPAIVREELRAGMETATGIALREIRSRAPGSGGLRNAIVAAYSGDRTEGRVTVLGERYQSIARYQEAGTGLYGPARRAYEILPRSASILRFRVGGRLVFATRVIHLGVKPHWFFRDGAEAAQPAINYQFRARLGNVTKRLAS